jgi:hypothetical protein
MQVKNDLNQFFAAERFQMFQDPGCIISSARSKPFKSSNALFRPLIKYLRSKPCGRSFELILSTERDHPCPQFEPHNRIRVTLARRPCLAKGGFLQRRPSPRQVDAIGFTIENMDEDVIVEVSEDYPRQPWSDSQGRLGCSLRQAQRLVQSVHS